ncbi:A/G-specific adenine glycosylase [mine drainage metagenome]|uniref:Adenine DNA glycosylase n=1 Tax=mine drainage metagenome TaxID=410659 RepID=A0A1J5QK01_9ZZZZ
MPLAPDDETGTAPAVTDALHETLLAWFGSHARDLPWRAAGCSPWGVLVSELMLQQTPVARVEPTWRAWMERWPTPRDLAEASTADVLRAWGHLGYPRRALRLQECARTISRDHAGSVPRTEDALIALPGIGAYTAAAVVAFAYRRRSVVLDTNVRRVLARVMDGAALPAPTLTVAERRRAASLVPDDDARAATWAGASMELGALVCTARAPHCDVCPVVALCRWRADGYPDDEHAHRRRSQPWTGTDRQARGRIMAELRAADHPVPETELARVWPDHEQRLRALDGLVDDGLLVRESGADADGDLPPTLVRLPR